MDELKQILRDMVHDPRFWTLVTAGVNLLYMWFVPAKYLAGLQVIDGLIGLFTFYITARTAVRAYRAREWAHAVGLMERGNA